MQIAKLLLKTLCLAAAIALPTLPNNAQAELRLTAQVYPLAGERTTALYNYKSEKETKGDHTVFSNTFTAPDGKVVVTETTELAGGVDGKLVSYSQDQKQVGTKGSVEIKNGKAVFSFTKDGKTKSDEESAHDDFIVGPTLMHYLQDHWSDVSSGKKVKFRFGVVDRLESVGFEFTKEKEDTLNGEKVVVIKMSASSLIISALVDPLHFYLTPDGHSLRELRGRTQPKRDDHGTWKDLDAVTVYQEAGGASK